ncbi:hypothetical protein [Micropruina sp.]|uniref:hypothetical protein n=1 Tax=Micropruina sp. TaxID=2737536 RepID=UPI0039E2456D
MGLKRIVAGVSVAGLAAGGLVASPAVPAHAAVTCVAGDLCIYDIQTSTRGRIPGNVRNWANLTGGWGNRADVFDNMGTQCNVDIHANTDFGGSFTILLLGQSLMRSNYGKSNRWCQH